MWKLIGPLQIPFSLNELNEHEKHYYDGFYEKEEKEYTNLLTSIKDPIVFDVGSNIGYFSCLFKSCGAKEVHCFEPIDEPFQLSREKLKDTFVRWPQSIILNKLALYHKKSNDEKIWVSRMHNQGSSMCEDVVEKFRRVFINNDNELLEKYIPTDTLDNYVKSHRIDKIDLLKLDTEGTEEKILMGAEQSLKDKKIKNIIFEAYEGSNAISFVLKFGYSIKLLDTYHPMYHAKLIT